MIAANRQNRLIQKAGSERSRLLPKRIAQVFLCVAFVVAGSHTFNAYLLPIQSLYVTGNISHMDKSELKRVVKKEIDSGFFAVNVNAIKAVVQQLAWVQSVSVRRVWPDSLHIEITEHVAVARWKNKHLINQRGQLFNISHFNVNSLAPDNLSLDTSSSVNYVDINNLPYLSGPEGSYSILFQHYREIESIIDIAELAVEKIIVDARRSMRVTLGNGIVLLLGRVVEDSYDYQELSRFVYAYNKTLVRRAADIREIDLRYTNGFAVQWKNNKLAHTTNMASFRHLRALI